MNTAELKVWATEHGTDVVATKDNVHALSSKLVRFSWQGIPTMGVGSDAGGKDRIDLVLDAVAWQRALHPGAAELRLVVGVDAALRGSSALSEQLGAIGTIASSIAGGPVLRLFVLNDGVPNEVQLRPAAFTTPKPGEWAQLLQTAASASPPGIALELAAAIDHPAFSIYPKLSTKGKTWQLRLDGIEIGRVGQGGNRLKLNSSQIGGTAEPHRTWWAIVGQQSVDIDAVGVPYVAQIARALIAAWEQVDHGPLHHGQPEHALEALILTGRLSLTAGGLALHPIDEGLPVLRSAQFPTLWGDVTAPARYLDALLRDDSGAPWAVELKDQIGGTGHGHGAYLRDGIAQAILYRHFICSCDALDDHFALLGLDRRRCRAALAFPAPKPGAEKIIASHHELAAMCDVEVVTFPHPG